MRRRIRNDKGQTIGYEPAVPLPEPSICPIFSQKVLEKNPADRYLSYDEFTMALYGARAQLLIQQSTQPPPESPKSKTSWWRR